MLFVSKSQSHELNLFLKHRRSFEGHLVGTQKADHTLTNYKSDLNTFEEYLRSENKGAFAWKKFDPVHLEDYSEYLKKQGFKPNTRRRKLLTLRKWFRYLEKRGNVDALFSSRLPAPARSERIPSAPQFSEIYTLLQEWRVTTPKERHQRAVMLLLLETGCQVHEGGATRPEHFSDNLVVEFFGKGARKVPVSAELQWDWANLGDVRPVTSRTIEFWVKDFARSIRKPLITPRSLRHARVLQWYAEKKPETEILKLLGLKSDFSLRMYRSWILQMSEKKNLAPAEAEKNSNTVTGSKI